MKTETLELIMLYFIGFLIFGLVIAPAFLAWIDGADLFPGGF